ncbi:MAG: hypothetical protein RL491_311 [Bacteroidota bacterium]
MIAQLSREYVKAFPKKILSRLYSYFLIEGRPATTKGRWFNPVTFAFLRTASKAKAIAESESPLFITGTGRSGSTILGMVLSAHNDVLFLNEPKALWYLANPADDIIGSYSNNEGRYMMYGKDLVNGCAQEVKGVYSRSLKFTGTSKIVDKYPEMLFRTDYLFEIFSKPRFIFLSRNAADTISSTANWTVKHRIDAANEDWWGVDGRKWKLLVEQVVPQDEDLSKHVDIIKGLTSESDKAAVEWIVSMNHGLKQILKYPDCVLRIRYEDLCENSDHELQRICDFAGMPADEKMLAYGRQTIKKQNVHKHPKVHPVLEEAIRKVSHRLGYGSTPELINVME